MAPGRLLAAIAASLLFAGAAPSRALDFPTGVVRIVVPYLPGGSAEAQARFLSAELQKQWGKPVIIENKPGAGTTVGAAYAATQKPDGLTLYLASTSHTVTPSLYKSLPYDPARDFTPVAMIVDFGPQILSINAEMPIKTAPELIAYAKANPGKLSYAVDVTAGAAPVCARLFNKRAGTGMVEVPYRSAAQMVQDVASGVHELLTEAGIDLRTQLLPDQLTLPLLWLGLIASVDALYIPAKTAIAGAVIGINPFDQPDVEASKVETKKLFAEAEASGALPAETPLFSDDAIVVANKPAGLTTVRHREEAAEFGERNRFEVDDAP